jgi:hypothetical protein
MLLCDYILFWHAHYQVPSLKPHQWLGADGRVYYKKYQWKALAAALPTTAIAASKAMDDFIRALSQPYVRETLEKATTEQKKT